MRSEKEILEIIENLEKNACLTDRQYFAMASFCWVLEQKMNKYIYNPFDIKGTPWHKADHEVLPEVKT